MFLTFFPFKSLKFLSSKTLLQKTVSINSGQETAVHLTDLLRESVFFRIEIKKYLYIQRAVEVQSHGDCKVLLKFDVH